MPPRKRQVQPSKNGHQTRSKRVRTSELTEAAPPLSQPAMSNPGLVSLDVNALSATISTAISEAVKTALSKDSLIEIMRQHTVGDGTSINASLAGQPQVDLSSDSVTTAVGNHISNFTGAGTGNDSFGSRHCSTNTNFYQRLCKS